MRASLVRELLVTTAMSCKWFAVPWICFVASCGSEDPPEPPRSIAERLAEVIESERPDAGPDRAGGASVVERLCWLLAEARTQRAAETADIESRVTSSFRASREDMRRLTTEARTLPFVRKLLEDVYAAGEEEPCKRQQVIVSAELEASTEGAYWDARSSGDTTSFKVAFGHAAERAGFRKAEGLADLLRRVAGAWVDVRAESSVSGPHPNLRVKHKIAHEPMTPIEFAGTTLPWLTLVTEIVMVNPRASGGPTREAVKLPKIRVRLGATIQYQVREGQGFDRSNEMSAVVDHMVHDLAKQYREAARDAVGLAIPDPEMKRFAGAYDLKTRKVTRNDCNLQPAASAIVIDAHRRAVLNPDGSAFPAKVHAGGRFVATFERAQDECPGKQVTARMVIERRPDGTLASTETISAFDAPSCVRSCNLVEEVTYVVAAASPGATPPAAAPSTAAGGPARPSFARPASANHFEAARQALALLEQRGPTHARYPDDCAELWDAVESGPLPAERDPAVAELVERVAGFCVRDLAIWLADRRLEIIATTEKVLEKKVTRFDLGGWDRICGFPLDTLARAASRYPDQARRFKKLAAPIRKRCGKRPAG